jgi:hypothetical protein
MGTLSVNRKAEGEIYTSPIYITPIYNSLILYLIRFPVHRAQARRFGDCTSATGLHAQKAWLTHTWEREHA